jgi:hypothetical protein
MDFDLNEQQSEVLNGLDQLIASATIEPPHEGVFVAWGADLDAQIAEAGYYDIVAAGLDLIDGALVVERLSQLPLTVEAAASVLIAPVTGLELPRPFAIASGSALAPARFLPIAKTLLVDQGDQLLAVEVDPANVDTLDTLFAYPYGKLKSLDGVKTIVVDVPVAAFHRRWRISMAAEAAGLMKAALDLVIQHVTDRRAFGRPIGSFQAVQHRLVMAAEVTEGVRWLGLKAADSDDDVDAAVASTYVQDSIPRFCTDLHQFCGAMGLTLEFPLHYYTYRLRALLGELGGGTGSARAMVALNWGAAA